MSNNNTFNPPASNGVHSSATDTTDASAAAAAMVMTKNTTTGPINNNINNNNNNHHPINDVGTKEQYYHYYQQHVHNYIDISYIVFCIAILHGIYMYCYSLYDTTTSTTIPKYIFGNSILQIPTQEECHQIYNNNSIDNNSNNNDKCGRPDLFAFQMVSGIVFITVSCISIYAQQYYSIIPSSSSSTTTKQQQQQQQQKSLTNTNTNTNTNTPEYRLYGYQNESYIILIINLSYQIWDFYISYYIIEEYNTTIMLLHHIVAAIVAYAGLYNSMLSTYSIFFLGVSEISSIFLVGMDIHKYFIISSPTVLTTSITNMNSIVSNILHFSSTQLAGPLFIITFVYYRIILWYPLSYQLWKDIYYVTNTKTSTTTTTSTPNEGTTNGTGSNTTTTTTTIAETIRPHRTYILYIWLAANLPMTVLQYYFLYLIVSEIIVRFV